MMPPACPAPVVPGAAEVPGAPVPAVPVEPSSSSSPQAAITAPMNGTERPMIVPRRMKLRRLIRPLAYASTRSRCTGPTLRRTRSSAFQSIGFLPRLGRTTATRRPCGWPNHSLAARESAGTSPVRGSVSAIARIEISHHRLPLDPPFPASWDPRPRTAFPVTIVRVVDDAGRVGVGSGDAMYGFADHQRWFIGEDPLDLERHGAVLANIDFHAGRPWPLDVALWDLAGQILDRPGVGPRRREGQRRAHLRLDRRPPVGRRTWRRSPDGPSTPASRR